MATTLFILLWTLEKLSHKTIGARAPYFCLSQFFSIAEKKGKHIASFSFATENEVSSNPLCWDQELCLCSILELTSTLGERSWLHYRFNLVHKYTQRHNSQESQGEGYMRGLNWVPRKKHASTVAEELLSLHLNLCLICAGEGGKKPIQIIELQLCKYFRVGRLKNKEYFFI